MKKFLTSLLILTYYLNSVLACDPDYAAFCQTSNGSSRADMHIFAGTIASKGDQNIELNVISLIRGNEDRSIITIWDGPEYRSEPDDDCDFYASGFTNQYGEIDDTIICLIKIIDEKKNDWEVIGDYRKPAIDPGYNSAVMKVTNGMVNGFSTIFPFAKASFSLFLENGCSIITRCTDPDACNYLPEAQVDSGDCYFDCEAPKVICPKSEVYFCEPSNAPPQLQLEDFVVSDNVTPANELSFSFLKVIHNNDAYTMYEYKYYFYDADGNKAQCEQRHFMPNESMSAPNIKSSINVCESEDAIILFKPISDYFHFYKDNDGVAGELVGSSNYGEIICDKDNFGIGAAETGTHQFWVSKEIREHSIEENRPHFSCESEPVLLTINVNPAPKTVLSDGMPTMKMGRYYKLMDLVKENKTGYWTGENILSFNSATEQNFYFFPRKTGLNKVFYTVTNGDCSETHTKVIEVQNFRLAESLNLSDPLLVFPNPAKGAVFVNLSNSVNVEHSIEVFDIDGKLHQQKNVNNVKNTLFELDLNHLPKGIYIVQVRNGINSNFKKLVIE